MAGAMRKMAVYLGLVEDEGDYQDDYYDDDYDDEPEPAPRRRSSTRDDSRSVSTSEPRTSSSRTSSTSSVRTFREGDPYRSSESSNVETRGTSTVRPISTRPAPAPEPFVDLYRITTIHPISYNDARRIGEEFREGIPVIMNLTEMEDGDAKRIVDFAAGLVFGLHGTIERITNKVFLLSPVNVDVGAEARAQLAQNGFFNQS